MTDCLINQATGVRLTGLPGLHHLPHLALLSGFSGAIVTWQSLADLHGSTALTDLTRDLGIMSVILSEKEQSVLATCSG